MGDPGWWSDRGVLPVFSILSAETHPELLSSVSIFLRRISSAMSEMRTQSIPIGVGRSPDLS